MQITKLKLKDKLPLTCSRTGSCCFGNLVYLNPWELARLAQEKGIGTREFRDKYTLYGGIRLLFNGQKGWKQKQACNQYIDNFGCSVHVGRPLACRLFPIGRQMQNGKLEFMHQGKDFPCLEGCPEVVKLPEMSVGEYLQDQQTAEYEQAQDAYLEVMEAIADIAFALLLDTELAKSGDKKTLPLWRKMSKEAPEALVKRIGADWIDALSLPEIIADSENPISFINKHAEILQLKAEREFETLSSLDDLHKASVLIMAVALQLARGLGANCEQLAEHFIVTAKGHGARE